MNTIKKIKIGLAMAGLIVTSLPAAASHLPGVGFDAMDFTFDPTGFGESETEFTANFINFSYFAEVDQAPTTTPGVNSFTESGFVSFSQFYPSFGVGISSTITGLSSSYNMYALFTAEGTSDFTSGSGAEGTFTSFGITFYVDPDMNTTVQSDLNPGADVTEGVAGGDESYTRGGTTSDDIDILSGTLYVGGFHVDPGLAAGDFDVIFDITSYDALVWGGDAFDVDPGQVHRGDLNGNNTTIDGVSGGAFTDAKILGNGNSYFAVPEPTSLAILGLGMLGLGFNSRRKLRK